ncbi:helix-turn-helix transcriptional regulator [Shewanella fidelis]|uniref:AraC family transcriptional regulator n=1 Tax=Shewanella fidelis TaxID=173509 RepID=A0AAW8NNK8_9GAMM|nr:AraC family transcriptional regulator [Shewanella fidelis]MDR8523399.1 AraC family transcriptional regulator [Shewanella fidelis]MDW4813367.1 AraC family transcriptional regulator [Shewanella fidelis]MDW4817261.1 AraC family transcriptional regulator [Shewanella fidelis]MDW4821382.1 AraC family transcriptional regulator [Shewanella fidelis]MDW4824540.1 AraC family transcriptional regulator [Shewanella fidelis]
MHQICSYKANMRVGDQSYPAYELKNIINYLLNHFAEQHVEQLLQDIGLDITALNSSEFVYVWQVDYAMMFMRRLSQDPEVAAKAASCYKVADLDVLQPYLAKFNTLGDCLAFAIAHPELVGSFSDTLIRNDSGHLHVRWLNTNKVELERYSCQFQHSICSLLAFAKELTSKPIQLSHIALAEPCRDANFLATKTGAQVEFDSEFFEWSISHDYLELPLTYPFERQKSQSTCDIESSYISELLTILRQHAPELPCMDAMAELQNISARTLRRRLAAANTSYQKLVDQVRCQMAIDLILTSDYSIEAISDLMGFGEVSHFRQSFKHWIGHPPGHFHRLNRPLVAESSS